MSTIYNPLTGSTSFLSEFSGGGNSIAGETAPSSLSTIAPGFGSPSGFGFPSSGSGSTGFTNPLSDVNILKWLVGGGSALPVSRIVAIVLGLLLIGGGIIMFRPETVEDVRGAATAAAAA